MESKTAATVRMRSGKLHGDHRTVRRDQEAARDVNEAIQIAAKALRQKA